ncbi:hypothetical protein RBH89_19905 [Paracidovorax avenae]
MPEFLIELITLLSLDCASTSILPNIETQEREKIINFSRSLLATAPGSQNTSFTPASKKRKNFPKQFNAELLIHLKPSTQATLKRYARRLEIGFNRSKNQDLGLVEDISIYVKSLEAGAFIQRDEITSILEEIKIKNEYDFQRKISLTDAIIGSTSEPTDAWDEQLADLWDSEYDIPYITSIALRLKPAEESLNFLYSWKTAIKPEDYEDLRPLVIRAISRMSEEDILLPY